MSINPNWPEEKPKKAGMSTTAKVFLWLGGGFVVLGLLCCGVVGYFFYGRFSQDPKVIAQRAQEMVDWSVPPEFTPVVYMNLMPIMSMAIYERQPPQGGLVLCEFGPSVAGQDKKQLEAEMKTKLREQGQQGAKDLQVEDEQTHTFTIRGKEVDFEFAKAKDAESGAEMWQVTGIFDGKAGPVFLMLQVPRDQYTEEQLKEMIGAIK